MTRKEDLPTVEVDITPHDEGNVKCSSSGIIVFVLGLVSGTFSALLCKMAYDSKSIGLDNQEKLFAKPIMMLLLMFAAVLLFTSITSPLLIITIIITIRWHQQVYYI